MYRLFYLFAKTMKFHNHLVNSHSRSYQVMHIPDLQKNIDKTKMFKIRARRDRRQNWEGHYGTGQNPVLVNIAELLPGFPINRNQFMATSAKHLVTSGPPWKFLKIPKIHHEVRPKRILVHYPYTTF